MAASRSDEEMGTRPNAQPPNPSVAALVASRVAGMLFGKSNAEEDDDPDVFSPEPPDEIVPADDALAIFRRLTGISSSPKHIKNKKLHLNRPAPNRGIYQHVYDEEQRAKTKYVFFSRLINTCLGLQIIVAAALTALGAGDGPHAVVTVFGAVNTVIAGFLTYLKGSGLPHQTKSFQSQWSKLREYIEQRERDFGCAGCALDVYVVVKDIEEWYDEIRKEIEANTPDGYTSTARAKDKRLGGLGGSRTSSNESSKSKVTTGRPTTGSETNMTMDAGREVGASSREEKTLSEF